MVSMRLPVRRYILLCALLALAEVSSASSVTAVAVIDLLLDTTAVDFGTLSQPDYNAGFKEVSPAQVVTITSNVNWALSVSAATATWTAPWAKPASDLQWRANILTQPSKFTSISTTYKGMTVTSVTVAAGKPGNNIKLNMHFKMLLSYENDQPGNYAIGFTYTVAPQ